jgi:transposase
MWPDLSQVRVMIRPGSTDMRKQINSLSAMVQNAMTEAPFSDDLYLFCSRDKTVIKAIYWDRNPYRCLFQTAVGQGHSACGRSGWRKAVSPGPPARRPPAS